MAQPVDLSALVSAVDFIGVIDAVLAVGLALISVYCVIVAVRKVLYLVRGESYYDDSDDFMNSIDGDFCFSDQRDVVWDKSCIGRSVD